MNKLNLKQAKLQHLKTCIHDLMIKHQNGVKKFTLDNLEDLSRISKRTIQVWQKDKKNNIKILDGRSYRNWKRNYTKRKIEVVKRKKRLKIK